MSLAAHSRCTLDAEMPAARAIVRQLHRPRCGGGVTACSKTRWAAASASHGLRPPRRIAQSRQPVPRKPPDPAVDLQARYAHPFGDLLLGQSRGAQQDDLRAPAVAYRHRARAKPALQFPSFLRPQLDPLPNHDPPNRPDHDTVAPSSMKPYFKYMTLGSRSQKRSTQGRSSTSHAQAERG